MRVLLVGAGGVGTAFARIAARRGVFEHVVVADYDSTGPSGPRRRPSDRFEAVRARRFGRKASTSCSRPSAATCS